MLLAIDSATPTSFSASTTARSAPAGALDRRQADRRRVRRLADPADGAAEGRRQDIDGAIIASRRPSRCYALKTLCERYFKVEPLVIGDPDVDLGIEVAPSRSAPTGWSTRSPAHRRSMAGR